MAHTPVLLPGESHGQRSLAGEKLGLKVIPVSEHDSYLNLYKKAHAELDALKAKLD